MATTKTINPAIIRISVTLSIVVAPRRIYLRKANATFICGLIIPQVCLLCNDLTGEQLLTLDKFQLVHKEKGGKENPSEQPKQPY